MQYVTTCKHKLYSSINFTLFYLFLLFFDAFLLISSNGKFLRSFVYVIIYCVDPGLTNLMSISDRLHPDFFCRKMEKTRSMKEEMKGEVFISRSSRHSLFIDNMIKVLFIICILIWRVNNYASRQGKV